MDTFLFDAFALKIQGLRVPNCRGNGSQRVNLPHGKTKLIVLEIDFSGKFKHTLVSMIFFKPFRS